MTMTREKMLELAERLESDPYRSIVIEAVELIRGFAELEAISEEEAEEIGTFQVFKACDTESGLDYDISANEVGHARLETMDGAKVYVTSGGNLLLVPSA